MKMKTIEQVEKEMVESWTDRQLMEVILDQVGTMNTYLKLNERIERNLKDKAKIARPDLKCIMCANEPVSPSRPTDPPRPCKHMVPAWDLWRKKYED